MFLNNARIIQFENPLSWSFPLLQVMPDGSQIPLSYRYKVVANSTVNSFKAKELAASDDKHNLRSAMFGALFCGRFTQLPHTNHCGVIWQAQDSKKLACWVLNLVLDGFGF